MYNARLKITFNCLFMRKMSAFIFGTAGSFKKLFLKNVSHKQTIKSYFQTSIICDFFLFKKYF